MFSFLKKVDPKDGLAIFSYLILAFIFFFRFLDGQEIMAYKDLSRYFYPLRYLMVEQVKSGHLPLWNPYIFCGFPLLATLQVGFFYPLTAILYVLPFNLAFNYYTILHYFLAACFMYFLLRHYKLERPSAFMGGMLFAFSGYLLSVSNMNTSLSSVIWLPLALLFFDRLTKEGYSRIRGFIIFSFILSLMFLGGEPTILYVTAWFLFFYALFFASQRLRSVILLLGALLLAAGLTAIQVIPFLELSRFSDRVTLTQFGLISLRSFPLREIATFVFPFFFGDPSQMGNYNEALLGKTYQDWLISPYLGILPLFFMGFSFCREKKLPAFFAAAAFFALLLAFGKYTPFFGVAFRFIPGVALIRYPVKYLFLVTFCLSMLSALGFQQIIRFFEERKESLRNIFWRVAFLSLFVLFFSLAAYLFSGRIISFFSQRYSNIPRVFFRLLGEIIRFNLQSLFNIAGYLFALSILLALAYLGKIREKIFIGALIALVAADLLANCSSIVVGASKQVFETLPRSFTILKKDNGRFRVFYTPEMEKENGMIYGENFSAAVFNAKDNFAANWHIPYHFFDFYGYESVKPLEFSVYYYSHLSSAKLKNRLEYLSLFNVKYIFSAEKINFPALKLLRHKRDYGANIYLYENQRALPRAYLLDERHRPILKGGRVVIKEYRPGKIVMAVSAEAQGLLFLSESFYPGWKFYVDGKKKRVLQANQFFSAVEISAGNHKVEYVYDPLSFKIGAGISILCVLCSVLCVLRWGGQRELNP